MPIPDSELDQSCALSSIKMNTSDRINTSMHSALISGFVAEKHQQIMSDLNESQISKQSDDHTFEGGRSERRP